MFWLLVGIPCLFLITHWDLLGTAETTGTTGSDQTDLATSRRISPDGRGRTNMLVITTTVGMVHRVHGHTTHTWPAVTLGLVLVVGSAGLEERLVDTTTAGNNSNHGPVGRGDDLLGPRW